jgi:hypothetical protein
MLDSNGYTMLLASIINPMRKLLDTQTTMAEG